MVSYGGGVNSTALLIGLHQHRIPVDLILFADTGAEHPHTYAYLDIMDYIWYASPNREALEQYPAYYQEVNEEELDPEIFQIMAPPEIGRAHV